jgi:phosphomannomutase/phosphoglucomutase
MYDIRGEVGCDINAEFAFMLGKTYGTYLRSTIGQNRWLAVGRDNRHSSEYLHEALCRGLVSTGCKVIDIGLSPSPVMNFSVANWQLSGGVNVTGSHSPSRMNGFKLSGPGAYPVADDDIQQLLCVMQQQSFVSGNGLTARMFPREAYIEKILSLVTIERRLTVVIDAGNGIAGLYAAELLRRFGCDVIELYCKSDGDFPNHIPDPENAESLNDLCKTVVNCDADIGLAYDGDGDRLGVVDEKGRQCSPEQVIVLLSRDFLTRFPGFKIMIDVKSSQAAIDEIFRYGGVPVLWKTGHSLIKRKMHHDKIMLAGEASGHYFPAENYYPIDDALLASCRILEYISHRDIPLSALLESIPVMNQESLEVDCPDDDKFDVVGAVQGRFAQLYPVIRIDGARIQMDGGWALVRASNTAPALSVRFEADTAGRLADIKKEVLSFLEGFPSVVLPSGCRTDQTISG